MSWFSNFLTSSIGRKLIMSLTGLFLIIFLVVHLAGNLQLLIPDEGKTFNLYAKAMTTNPIVQAVSILLYLSILLHAVQGWVIWRKNRLARGASNYAVKVTRAVSTDSWPARNMAWLGTIIFVFIVIHLYQFWLQMKLDYLPYATYDGEQVKNLYIPVKTAFNNLGFVLFYIGAQAVIAFHLAHGFQSSFQTLGINHQKYTPAIKFIGKAYSILIPLGFAIIPVLMYGQKMGWW